MISSNIRVTKELTFDCAHMLSNYNGACQNLHGHTYKLQVTCEKELDFAQPTGNAIVQDTGMVVDFKNLKQVLEDEVMAKFDHAFIANILCAPDSTEAQVIRVIKDAGMKMLEFSGRTTAENMCRYIFITLNDRVKMLFENTRVVNVKLWETPTSFAEVGE